jgi:hypothetical protein
MAPSVALFATITVALPELAAGEPLAAGEAIGLAAGVPALEVVEVVGGAVETPAPLLVVPAEVAVDEVEEPQAASVNASSRPTPSRATVDRGFIRGFRFIPSPFLVMST